MTSALAFGLNNLGKYPGMILSLGEIVSQSAPKSLYERGRDHA
jgi:hypothetical protein